VLPLPVTQPQRLAPQRQQVLITQQRQRTVQYGQHLQQQESILLRSSTSLQKQNRMAQYRYHQQYLEHLRQQQLAVRQSYDYNSDPYYYTAPSYRYQRAGHYYSVNRYAAELLQDAVNYGYDQGFEVGQADRADHWRYDYAASYAYQDADYGYYGRYVDRDDYNYYFRQGFRRGYQDGYYRRYRYGVRINSGFRINGSVLKVIIDLRPLR
jgi:hypothetical protein